MSRKNSVLNHLVDGGDMSGNVTGTIADCRNMEFITFQCIYSGTSSPVGTITVEATLDGTNWTELALSTINVTADGTDLVDLYNINYQGIRIKYNRSSGTGTINIWYKGRY